ncbi:MAG: GNAT family N-acetyltransferase [Calditrichaeota bacterium]|nr:MAG: GNAT family N-acetyltransferase [Calditrichota bacterium]
MNKVEVERYCPEHANAWDAFVDQANNGTLFHKRTFLSYHPPERFIEDSLLFYKKGRLLAVLPAARRHGDDEKILISHPGASFGGFVVRPGLSLRDAIRLVSLLLEYAREHHYGGIDLTLPPIIYLKRPSHYIDFALYKAGFSYRKREVSSVVPLAADENGILARFSPESRRNVRRAQKLGVQVRQDRDYATFYQILQKNLKLRHNVIPTHSLDELLLLVERFPEAIRLFAAYVEDRMVAGIVLFNANPQVTLAFYISHDEAYQKYRAVNLLFYEVFRWCIRQGFRYLDFGLFTVNMEPNWGLARFKEGFGAQGVFRDSYKIQLV